jgi:GNAT superfamily N-acetyltransferase
MQIQPFELSDLPSLTTLQPKDWGDIRPVYEFYLISTFCNPVKMVHERMVIGIGSSIWHQNTAWIGHVIVHPDWWSQGIGSRITQHLVDGLKQMNYASISLVSTPMGVPMYEKLGFIKQWDYIFYEYPQKFKPPIMGDCIVSYQPSFMEQIFLLDKEVSREERTAIIGLHINQSKLFILKGKLQGVYFPTLGEGLILVKTVQAGIELAKFRLLENLKSVVPEQNQAVIELLESMDMSIDRTGTRMYIGKPIQPITEMIFNRIGGNMG